MRRTLPALLVSLVLPLTASAAKPGKPTTGVGAARVTRKAPSARARQTMLRRARPTKAVAGQQAQAAAAEPATPTSFEEVLEIRPSAERKRGEVPTPGSIEDALLDLFGSRDFIYHMAARERAEDNGLATSIPAQRAQMEALSRRGVTEGHTFVARLLGNYTVAETLRVTRVDHARHASPDGDYVLYAFKDGSGALIDGTGFAIPQSVSETTALVRAWAPTPSI